MYIHMGNGKYLRGKDILGIFDMDTATVCVATRRFLAEKEKEGCVLSADEELPKSFLLLAERRIAKGARKKTTRKEKNGGEGEEVILSKFSTGVLFSRSALTASIEEKHE